MDPLKRKPLVVPIAMPMTCSVIGEGNQQQDEVVEDLPFGAVSSNSNTTKGMGFRFHPGVEMLDISGWLPGCVAGKEEGVCEAEEVN